MVYKDEALLSSSAVMQIFSFHAESAVEYMQIFSFHIAVFNFVTSVPLGGFILSIRLLLSFLQTKLWIRAERSSMLPRRPENGCVCRFIGVSFRINEAGLSRDMFSLTSVT